MLFPGLFWHRLSNHVKTGDGAPGLWPPLDAGRRYGPGQNRAGHRCHKFIAPTGQRRNVDKLLADAHRSELVSTPAFLEYLAALSEVGVRESEAPAEAGGAVQLMTIHKISGSVSISTAKAHPGRLLFSGWLKQLAEVVGLSEIQLPDGWPLSPVPTQLSVPSIGANEPNSVPPKLWWPLPTRLPAPSTLCSNWMMSSTLSGTGDGDNNLKIPNLCLPFALRCLTPAL
jgi:hypothetical protein